MLGASKVTAESLPDVAADTYECLLIIGNANNDGVWKQNEIKNTLSDALASPKLKAISTIHRSEEKHKNYNNLNNEFSKRMEEISKNEVATSSKMTKKTEIVDLEMIN
ncbi:hypothetical protein C1646_818388 [Rhizophagus diaphanus]|nr:hypothetical protein C1646_818388 [Rhizophagus diaphanus] [Rhizophagus sp. MUCL 43196]